MRPVLIVCALAALAAAGWWPGTARAAQSYDNCAGTISTLPATISTQGVWCLKKDLSTSMSSGFAIDIQANNVTIDCNDFKIGGLAAGNGSATLGIYATGRQNVTVRNCGIRGFSSGIYIDGGSGHLVEDNRLDNNLSKGIVVSGDNSLVRGNRVFDTGGAPDAPSSYGIFAAGDIIGNTVSGVFATAEDASGIGILALYPGPARVEGNRISGFASAGTGIAEGIIVDADSSTIRNNSIVLTTLTTGIGVNGFGASTVCMGNAVVNMTAPYDSCDAVLDNVHWP